MNQITKENFEEAMYSSPDTDDMKKAAQRCFDLHVKANNEAMKNFKDWCDDNEIMMNFESEHNHTNSELLALYLESLTK